MLQDYLGFTELNECYIKLKPVENEMSCKINDTSSNKTISKCIDFKPNTSADDDVQYACENVDSYRFPNVKHNGTVYKNQFCVVGNSIKEHDVVDCHVSSSFTNLLNKSCQEFPRTNVYSNYRNIFCEMCHADLPPYVFQVLRMCITVGR